MSKNNGLQACVEAFERLKQGNPSNHKHLGLHRAKITAGVVSYEAGLDRGYLKRSRANHVPLLLLIKSYANDKPSPTEQKNQVVKASEKKVQEHKNNTDLAEALLHKALSRELLLVSKIKELEKRLSMFETQLGRI
jgi:hypothetical protein